MRAKPGIAIPTTTKTVEVEDAAAVEMLSREKVNYEVGVAADAITPPSPE